eukprot:m.694769 g.694769  ORF g.694769 m.694769 type:complete len:943 (-) comp22884_c2_seq9:1552-4380(-)
MGRSLFLLALAMLPLVHSRSIGSYAGISTKGIDTFDIKTTTNDVLRVVFFSSNTARLWLAPNGNFSDDPASADIVVGTAVGIKANYSESAASVTLSGGDINVVVQKTSMLLSMQSKKKLLWTESSPIEVGASSTTQTLHTTAEEHFFGGGMQNGRWAHKGHSINISTSFNWADGGTPNSVPLYMSTAGYGVYRNTWARGTYDFSSNAQISASHDETRFDAYFFVGDFKEVLGAYTQVTGAPFLVPIYGLHSVGDSDCYHNDRHGNSTQVVLAVADKYRENNMPGAWFLPNDGYGCGFGESDTKFPKDFSDLDFVVKELHNRGFYTGLWSSTGLPNITREVAGSGVRIGKTDVGWIGRGYEYAFDSVRLVSDGIEDNSDGRRFIWTVEGWAGTHRYAVMWTGDDSGSFEYIRWQLPTFVGCGFSAQAHVSGDIDGIFGGSPDTYVRDLQFKCMMTTMMTMSGWAANPNKQPWTYGEPYTSINRMYLKLKSRLTPYFYSYSRVAYDTGVPPVRAMALEFPSDLSTLTNHTGTAYQFMSGEWFLVAPVYENTTVRDGIYLPAGIWVDWWDGTVYTGPTTLNGYDAPLTKLPIFVKSGAIIPMWPEMMYFNERPHDPLTIQIYPDENVSTSFTLYEDDGVTRAAIEKNAFSKTVISCDVATPSGDVTVDRSVTQPINITIGPSKGDYTGKPTTRAYMLQIHVKSAPKAVLLHGKPLNKTGSTASLDFADSGWFYNTAIQKPGVLLVKVPPQSLDTEVVVSLSNGPQFPHVCLVQCDSVLHHQVLPQVFSFDATTGTIILNATGACLTASDDPDSGSHTPAVELQPCGHGTGTQTWEYSTDTLNICPKGNTRKCIDQDTSDKHAEMYGCGNKQINQQCTCRRGLNLGRATPVHLVGNPPAPAAHTRVGTTMDCMITQGSSMRKRRDTFSRLGWTNSVCHPVQIAISR